MMKAYKEKYSSRHGGVYTGEVLIKGNSIIQYHGKGTYKGPDGGSYEGDWVMSLREGYGIYRWPDIGEYEGFWKAVHQHGFGKMKWADGAIHAGNWIAGKREGHSTVTTPDGEVYKGVFELDKRNGSGQKWFSNGTLYEGTWCAGIIQSKGLFTFVDGSNCCYDREEYSVVLMNTAELENVFLFKYKNNSLGVVIRKRSLRGLQLVDLTKDDLINLGVDTKEEQQIMMEVIAKCKSDYAIEKSLINRIFNPNKLRRDLHHYFEQELSKQIKSFGLNTTVYISSKPFFLPNELLNLRLQPSHFTYIQDNFTK